MTRQHTTPTATTIMPAQATSTQSINVMQKHSPQGRSFAGLAQARAVMQAGVALLVMDQAHFLKRSTASQ